MRQIAVGLVVFLIIGGLVWWQKKPKNSPSQISMTVKDNKFSLETALSNAQKAKGLSGRKELCGSCGMVFIYQKQGSYPFWMKNTLIPLDIIWIDSDYKVVDIKSAWPEVGVSDGNLKIYRNQSPARLVVEIRGGMAEEAGIKIGDEVIFDQKL